MKVKVEVPEVKQAKPKRLKVPEAKPKVIEVPEVKPKNSGVDAEPEKQNRAIKTEVPAAQTRYKGLPQAEIDLEKQQKSLEEQKKVIEDLSTEIQQGTKKAKRYSTLDTNLLQLTGKMKDVQDTFDGVNAQIDARNKALQKYEDSYNEYEQSIKDYEALVPNMTSAQWRTAANYYNNMAEIQDEKTYGSDNADRSGRRGFSAASEYLSKAQYAQARADELEGKEFARDMILPYKSKSDFGTNSAYDPNVEDNLYKTINGHDDSLLGYLGSEYSFDPKKNEYVDYAKVLTDEERGVYNYIYKTGGSEDAEAWLDKMNGVLQARRQQRTVSEAEDFAKNFPLLSLVSEVGMATFVSPFVYAAQFVDKIDDGVIDESSPVYNVNRVRDAIVNTWVNYHIPNAVGNVDKTINDVKVGSQPGNYYYNPTANSDAKEAITGVAQFGFQTFLSMAHFLANAAVTGNFAGGGPISEELSLALMSSDAASSEIFAAKERGLDDDAAFLYGTLAGMAEYVTEKFSLETLLDADLYNDSLTRYVVKNAIAEGSEEGASDLINFVTDQFINGGNSQFAKTVKMYDDAGDERAVWHAVGDELINTALDMIGGALSGFALSGVQSAKIANTYKQTGAYIRENGGARYVTDLIETGLMSEDAPMLKRRAQEAAKDLFDMGYDIKHLTDKQIGELDSLIDQYLETSAIKESVAETMRDLNGENDIEAESFGQTETAEQTEQKPLAAPAAEARAAESNAVTAENNTTEEVNNVENASTSEIRGIGQSLDDVGRTTESHLSTAVGSEEHYEQRSAVRQAAGEEVSAETLMRQYRLKGISKTRVKVLSEDAIQSIPHLKQLSDEAKANGAELHVFTTPINVATNSGTVGVLYGWKSGKEVWISADASDRTAEMSFRHEYNHYDTNEDEVRKFADRAKQIDGWKEVFDTYQKQYAQIDDVSDDTYVWEEIMGDALGEIDKYGAGKFTEAAYDVLSERESVSADVEENVQENEAEPQSERGPPQTLGEEITRQVEENTKPKKTPAKKRAKKAAPKTIGEEITRQVKENVLGPQPEETSVVESVVEQAEGKVSDSAIESLEETAEAVTNAQKLLEKMRKQFPVDDMMKELGSEAYAAPMGDEQVIDDKPTKMSFESNLRGAGIQYTVNKDGSVSLYHGPLPVNPEDITGDMLKSYESAIGVIISTAKDAGTMTQEQADAIYERYAEMLRYGANLLDQPDGTTKLEQDAVWRWQVANEVFAPVKSNSDKQYNTSIDFLTICKKTEQLMRVVSRMQQELGRGLTPEEMMDAYEETGKAGYQTPCPICYVFAHWIDNGKLLSSVKSAQEYYRAKGMLKTGEEIEEMTASERIAYQKKWKTEFDKQSKYAEDNKKTFSKARADISSLLTDYDATARLWKAEKNSTLKDLLGKQKEAISRQYEEAVKMLSQSDYASWIKSNVLKFSKNGTYSLYEDFNFIPDDTLFDMMSAAEVAQNYPGVRRYKASKGSDAGKQIETETNAEIGAVISGIADVGGNNPLAHYDSMTVEEQKKARKAFKDKFESARRNAARQTLIGGQRIFSWSDNRLEYGPDMFSAFVQLTALGSSVQSYTKQTEALELIAKMGGYCNASLIAYGAGFVETTATDPEAVKVDGKYYKLEFSTLQGIDPKKTFKLNQIFDKAGNILVGMSDEHIRIALADNRIFFVIPYHTSSLKSELLNRMFAMLREQNMNGSAFDYTKLQNDAFVSGKTTQAVIELWKQISEMSGNDFSSGMQVDVVDEGTALSKSQKAYRDLRNRIIARNAKDSNVTFTRAEIRKIESDEFLQTVWEKTKNVSTNSAMLEAIYPYEYWDESTTYDTADINGVRYLEYCRRLGVIPKFSGLDKYGNVVTKKIDETSVAYGRFVDLPGYWKTLVDRRMYKIDGTYQGTEAVTAYTFETADIIEEKIVEKHELSKAPNPSAAPGIAEDALARRRRVVNAQVGTEEQSVEAYKQSRGETEQSVKNYEKKRAETDKTRLSYEPQAEADMFYSKLQNEVDAMKQDKISANGVIPYLKGHGVKDEEIKWTGIQQFVDGKKSVTKKELSDFVKGNQIEIEETTLTQDGAGLPIEDQERLNSFEAEMEDLKKAYKARWQQILEDKYPTSEKRDRYSFLHPVYSAPRVLQDIDEVYKGELKKNREYSDITDRIKESIKHDDYGFDDWRDAYRIAISSPEEFIDEFDIYDEGLKSALYDLRDFLKSDKVPARLTTEERSELIEYGVKIGADWRQIVRILDKKREIDSKTKTVFDRYKTRGGKNYKEIIFTLPGSDYTNKAMNTHWAREGVLAHARVQDFYTQNGKMLFVEEIQSDWHNKGSEKGYADYSIREENDAIDDAIRTVELIPEFIMANPIVELDMVNESLSKIKSHNYSLEYVERNTIFGKADFFVLNKDGQEVIAAGDSTEFKDNFADYFNDLNRDIGVPDAPFRDTYQDYVMKRIIRAAAENDYDSIGWTTAEMQSNRWSDRYAKGYTIEYDQQIPQFMRKYVKQWGSSVSKTTLPTGDTVWYVPVTQEMRDSVMRVGQPRFSFDAPEAAQLAEAEEAAKESASETLSEISYVGRGVFRGTQLMQDYGIKIANPVVTDYSLARDVRLYDRAANDKKAEIRKLKAKVKVNAIETSYARRIASDLVSIEELRKNKPVDVRVDVVDKLAELMKSLDEFEDDTIAAVRGEINSRLEALADDTMRQVEDRKKLAALTMHNQTPRRLMTMAFGDEKGAMVYDRYFRSITDNNGAMIRWINDMYDRVRDFKLSKADRETAQKLVEGIKVDGYDGHLDEVVNTYRKIYRDMYDMINDFLVIHGCQPIGFIKDYAPHMQPESVARGLDVALDKLGLRVTDLPTSISGRTSEFKPRHKFVRNFLHRRGPETIFDIEQGYQDYVAAVAQVFYHTDDIIRLRELAKYLRATYNADNQEVKFKEAYAALATKKLEEKQQYLIDNGVESMITSIGEANSEIQKIIDALEKQAAENTKDSELVKYLDNFTNVLAGKQNRIDRWFEEKFGRRALNVSGKIVTGFQMGNVAGNISSVLNQSAQLPMIFAELGTKDFAGAISDIVSGRAKETKIYSDFLTGKNGIDFLVTDLTGMMLGMTFKPAEFVDSFISTIAVQGRYRKEIRNGKTSDEALRAADDFGRSIMGSRMTGEKPMTFTEKNFFSRLINLFQIEAANTFNHVLHDLPADFRKIKEEKGTGEAIAALLWVIAKAMIATFLMNRVTEGLYGGTPAPGDVIGNTASFIASGEELPTNEWIMRQFDNVSEAMFGSRIFGTKAADPEHVFNTSNAIKETVGNVGDDLPYVQNFLATFGIGDNTIAVPGGKGATQLIDDIEKGNADKYLGDLGDIATEVASTTIPGRQIVKSVKGIRDYVKGGSYNSSGNLRFPVDDSPATAIKNALFGQYANEQAQKYFARGGSALSEKRTGVYNDLVNAGVNTLKAYELVTGKYSQDAFDACRTAGIGAENAMTIAQIMADTDTPMIERRAKLSGIGLSEEDLETAARALLTEDDYADYSESGLDYGEYYEIKSEVSEAQSEYKQSSGDNLPAVEKWKIVIDMQLPEEDTMSALHMYMTESQYRKCELARKYDVTPDTYVRFRSSLPNYDEDDNGSYKQDEVTSAIRALDLGKSESAVLWQTYAGWSPYNNPFSVEIGILISEEMKQKK